MDIGRKVTSKQKDYYIHALISNFYFSFQKNTLLENHTTVILDVKPIVKLKKIYALPTLI